MAKGKLTRLGRYKIVSELGRGAMGVVYKATDPVLDRTVALKTIILSPDLTGRAEYEARFFQEAKAAGRLSHPAIITIYDFGEEGDLAYMAMELLDGTELRTRMSQGPIPAREAIDIAERVAEGLGFAHEHGVVHRDIKPSNIMLAPRGRVKIMDFGIARVRVSDLKTQTGTKLGTPKYMSPEQVMGRPADHRSDIFSLGIVLYEMLTRAALFAGSDTTQVMYNVANLRQVMPSRINPDVPTMLDLVVARALEKDVDDRYQDAYALAADLRACLAELGPAPLGAKPSGEKPRDEARAAKSESAADATRTLKLGAQPETTTIDLAPEANAIGSETCLPLSVRFDSSSALKRLAVPSRKDRALLTRAPRPAGTLRRLARDPSQRRLLGLVIGAALVGGMIAFS